MKTNFKIIATIIVIVGFISCTNQNNRTKTDDNAKTYTQPLVENVLSAEEQAALTPDMVINNLKKGNIDFMNNNITDRDHSAQVRNSTNGQYPEAIILSCIDSRVPVEVVFNKGIGDLFVARVAGNFVNVDILGSMEFACRVSGSKLILVMGHEHCGAVKAAIDDVELGNITAMLTKIKPAVELSSDYQGEKTSDNDGFVHEVCENNVINTINEIRVKSPVLKEMEDNNEIKIVGAVYNMSTGKVTFLDN